MNTMRESAERVSENMFSVQMSKVNQDVANQPGSTSMLTMVKVTDPPTYMKAMKKMKILIMTTMETQMEVAIWRCTTSLTRPAGNCSQRY